MVDRVIVYDGAIPQTLDILNTNLFNMFGTAFLSRAVLGSSTEVHGMAIAPTSPTPNLNVTISPGSIYQLDETDATAYGDLGVNASTIYKQGINYNTVTLTVTPPGTAGFAQNYLVQIALDDIDSGQETLSYFNASNPAAPWSGPNNSGMSQFTVRTCACVVALKAGVAATSGTQNTPAADAGFTGLYSITVVNGATQITSSNISTLTAAPFFPTLPAVPGDVQDNAWTYAVDTSSGGAPVATNATTATNSSVLHFASVPAWVSTGMGVADLTTTAAIGSTLTVLGIGLTAVTLSSNVSQTVLNGDSIAFSSNAIVASVSPVPAALTPGLECKIKLNSTNTGATTLNLNSLGATPIKRGQGTNPIAGDLNFGQIANLVYDGTNFQILNFEGTAGGVSNTTTTTGLPYTNDIGTIANTVVANPTPSLGSYSAGYTIEVNIANTNISASTLNVSGLGAKTILNSNGNPLLYGEIVSGVVALFVYNGSAFNLINTASPLLQGNLIWYVNGSTGSDTLLDGTSATVSGNHGPFATIQHALNVTQQYNMAGFNQTINVANGTYTGGIVAGPNNGAGTIFLVGGSAVSCIISNSSGSAASFNGPGNFDISAFGLSATGGILSDGIAVNGNATVSVHSVRFTAATGYHMSCGSSGANLNTSGTIFIASNSNCFGHVNAGVFGNVDMSSTVFNIQGPVNFGQGFVVCETLGVIAAGSSTFLNPSLVSGPKYVVVSNSIINTNGGGANYFPGTIAGMFNSNGIYE